MLKCNNFANVDCNKHGYMSKCVPGDPYVYSVKVWKYYLLYYEYGYNEFTTIMKKFSSRLQNTIIFPFNKNIFLKEFVSITNSLFINVFVLWIVVQTLTKFFLWSVVFCNNRVLLRNSGRFKGLYPPRTVLLHITHNH